MPLSVVASELIVNTTTPGSQFEPTVAALPDGRFIVTWIDNTGDGSGTSIRGRILNSDGTALGADFLVNTSTAGNQLTPSVTALPDGRIVVTWTSQDGGDGSGTAIRGRILNSDGTVSPNDFIVNTTTTNNQLESSVTALSDGRFVVTWRDNGGDGSGNAVRGRIIDSDGVPASPNDFLVNTTTTSSQRDPSVTALSDGRFFVAWFSQDIGDGSGTTIRGRILNSDGTPSPNDFIVNTTTANNQLEPSVTALSDGRIVVTWRDAGGDGAGSAIRGRILNSDGTASPGDFLINSTALGDQFVPSVTALPEGRFVVTWHSFDDGDGSGTAIRARVFGGSGSALGDDFVVNTSTTGDQFQPSVAALANGNFVISWQDTSGDGSASAIRAIVLGLTPETNNVTVNGAEDTTTDILLNGTEDSPIAEFVIDTLPGSGVLYRVNGDGSLGNAIIAGETVAASGNAATIRYAPPLNGHGDTSFTYHAVDSNGIADVSPATVSITVAPVNDAPVAPLIDPQSVAEEAAWTYVAPAFTDIDDATLIYTATLAGGALLPAWLSFDADTRTFTGTPPLNFDGDLSLTVTATDAANATASATFTLDVTPVNDAPVAPLIDPQSVAEDTAWTYVVPAFTDIDDATLTYTATLAGGAPLPTWLSFDADTRTFTGTPPLDFDGDLSLTVTAADAANATASATFTLDVTPVNDAPVAPIIDPQSVAEDTAWTYVVPAFTDVDDATLTYTAALAGGAPLPAWLSFAADTQTFTGTPPLNFDGDLSLTVTATDAANATASATFTLDVTPVNDAPVAPTIDPQSVAEDTAWTYVVPAFTDVDDATLTYTAALAGGAPLPAWLSFAADTQTFTGTPPLNFDGDLSLTVTATDAANATASATFTLDVTPVNDAPVAPLIDPQSVAEDTAWTYVVPAFTDVDDATLTYTAALAGGALLPAWLSFDTDTRTFTATPPLDFDGDLSLTVTAADAANATASATFTLDVTPVNDAPVAPTIDTQSVAEDTAWTYVVPAFTDVDDATLTYTAALAGGALLPAWLSFDADTRTFTGTPPLEFDGDLSLTVTAADAANATASATFTLDVTPVNDAPVAPLIDPQSVAEEAAWTYVVPAFTDVDDATLTYTAALAGGAPLPAWLSFDADTRTFTGTPPLDFDGDLSLTVTAADAAGATASATFTLDVTPVNDAPVAPLIDTQSVAEEAAWTYVVPAFTDVDDATLTYTASLAGGAPLPAWLSFAADTRTFTGTPPLDFDGDLSLTVTAADAANATASATFTLDVTPVNDAPTSLTATPVPVNENSVGSVVGSISVVDIDSTYNYAVLADDDTVDTRFTVAADGTISLAAGVALDFEAPGDLTLQVESTETVTGERFVTGFAVDLRDVTPEVIVTGFIAGERGDATAEDEHFVAGPNPATARRHVTYAASTDAVNVNLDLHTSSQTTAVGGFAAGDWFTGINNLTGSDFADTLAGSGANDTLNGGAGGDDLFGGAGDDWLIFDEADLVSGSVSGSDGFDTASLSSAGGVTFDMTSRFIEQFIGNAGNDVATAAGSTGNAYLYGRGGDDQLTGGNANDVLVGDVGVDTLRGGLGQDSLYGGADNDQLNGNEGNDVLIGEGGNDAMSGGAGQDYAYGGDGDDRINGDDGDDILIGEAGVDTLHGGLGQDTLYGGADTDQLNGNEGNDILIGDGGNDIMSGGTGQDYAYGGDGGDTIDGDDGDDVLIGEAGDDVINGGAGQDYIYSGIGANTLNGGEGGDILISEGSSDTMAGGSGANYFYRTAAGTSQSTGGFDADMFVDFSGSGVAASADTFAGEGGVDTAYAGNGNDTVNGGAGNDVLLGEADNDTLVGAADHDSLYGGDGNDILAGGTGINGLFGGAGNDTFRVDVSEGAQTQVIYDFLAGGADDTVQLQGLILSAAQMQALIDTPDTIIGGHMMYNAGSGAQLYLNIGTDDQIGIWLQDVAVNTLTAADFELF